MNPESKGADETMGSGDMRYQNAPAPEQTRLSTSKAFMLACCCYASSASLRIAEMALQVL